jgi:hypothetical protein
VLLAIAAVAVLAGALIAILTSRGGGHESSRVTSAAATRHVGSAVSRQVELAARYLGIPVAQLRSRMRRGLTLAQIADATPGRSTAGLISALVAGLGDAEHGGDPSGRDTHPARLRRRVTHEVERLPGYSGLPSSARYLGISVTELRAQLQSGRSLAQIADAAPGRSAAGLLDARIQAREARIKAAVASDRISKPDAEMLLSSLRERVAAEVQHVPGS